MPAWNCSEPGRWGQSRSSWYWKIIHVLWSFAPWIFSSSYVFGALIINIKDSCSFMYKPLSEFVLCPNWTSLLAVEPAQCIFDSDRVGSGLPEQPYFTCGYNLRWSFNHPEAPWQAPASQAVSIQWLTFSTYPRKFFLRTRVNLTESRPLSSRYSEMVWFLPGMPFRSLDCHPAIAAGPSCHSCVVSGPLAAISDRLLHQLGCFSPSVITEKPRQSLVIHKNGVFCSPVLCFVDLTLFFMFYLIFNLQGADIIA